MRPQFADIALVVPVLIGPHAASTGSNSSPSHGENRGSSPLGSASKINDLARISQTHSSFCLFFV
jgi:hypothetical protein